jgi:transcriptional regulator with XRE-family HTH domain
MRAEIGRILKAYRERLQRNQRAVADAAGISTSMLSQIENGAVSPSIDTLATLCATLGLEMGELFSRVSPKRAVTVHRPGDRLCSQTQGIGYEQLAVSPNPGFPAELLILELAPGKATGMSRKGHEGVELGYILEGEAILRIAEEEVHLRAGDSVSYSSHLPHCLENPGTKPFRAVWSIQPPHKDYLDIG